MDIVARRWRECKEKCSTAWGMRQQGTLRCSIIGSLFDHPEIEDGDEQATRAMPISIAAGINAGCRN
jgi:hypothetical protein